MRHGGPIYVIILGNANELCIREPASVASMGGFVCELFLSMEVLVGG